MPSIEFRLGEKRTLLGRISDPKITVAVYTRNGERAIRFLLDTGADFSMAPRDLADDIGLDWAALRPVPILGIGRNTVSGRVGRLPIRIGPVDLALRCVFAEGPGTPLILGRADLLDRFVVTIDQTRHRIVLDSVP